MRTLLLSYRKENHLPLFRLLNGYDIFNLGLQGMGEIGVSKY